MKIQFNINVDLSKISMNTITYNSENKHTMPLNIIAW